MLSKSSKYAIQAVVLLAENQGSFYGVSSIAKSIEAPQNYLGKMLQQLASNGLLISQKGYGGGFSLAQSPSKVSLFDIVEIIDRITQKKSCVLGNEKCSDRKPCAIHQQWKKLYEAHIRLLKSTTIENLLTYQELEQCNNLGIS